GALFLASPSGVEGEPQALGTLDSCADPLLSRAMAIARGAWLLECSILWCVGQRARALMWRVPPSRDAQPVIDRRSSVVVHWSPISGGRSPIICGRAAVFDRSSP